MKFLWKLAIFGTILTGGKIAYTSDLTGTTKEKVKIIAVEDSKPFKNKDGVISGHETKIRTDKGTFVNQVAWFRGKDQDDVENLNVVLKQSIGKTFNLSAYGEIAGFTPLNLNLTKADLTDAPMTLSGDKERTELTAPDGTRVTLLLPKEVKSLVTVEKITKPGDSEPLIKVETPGLKKKVDEVKQAIKLN